MYVVACQIFRSKFSAKGHAFPSDANVSTTKTSRFGIAIFEATQIDTLSRNVSLSGPEIAFKNAAGMLNKIQTDTNKNTN